MTAQPVMTDSVMLKVGDTVSVPDVGGRMITSIRQARPNRFQMTTCGTTVRTSSVRTLQA